MRCDAFRKRFSNAICMNSHAKRIEMSIGNKTKTVSLCLCVCQTDTVFRQPFGLIAYAFLHAISMGNLFIFLLAHVRVFVRCVGYVAVFC